MPQLEFPTEWNEQLSQVLVTQTLRTKQCKQARRHYANEIENYYCMYKSEVAGEAESWDHLNFAGGAGVLGFYSTSPSTHAPARARILGDISISYCLIIYLVDKSYLYKIVLFLSYIF